MTIIRNPKVAPPTPCLMGPCQTLSQPPGGLIYPDPYAEYVLSLGIDYRALYGLVVAGKCLELGFQASNTVLTGAAGDARCLPL